MSMRLGKANTLITEVVNLLHRGYEVSFVDGEPRVRVDRDRTRDVGANEASARVREVALKIPYDDARNNQISASIVKEGPIRYLLEVLYPNENGVVTRIVQTVITESIHV